jgi:hypothetical protein
MPVVQLAGRLSRASVELLGVVAEHRGCALGGIHERGGVGRCDRHRDRQCSQRARD